MWRRHCTTFCISSLDVTDLCYVWLYCCILLSDSLCLFTYYFYVFIVLWAQCLKYRLIDWLIIMTWMIKVTEMTSVTARALYMVTDWDRKWWRDESWGVTGRQATMVQKWRAGVNCSRCEQRQPERLGPRRWIVECGRRSVIIIILKLF